MAAIAIILIIGIALNFYGIATAKDMPDHD
jgi:hypothetical protein